MSYTLIEKIIFYKETVEVFFFFFLIGNVTNGYIAAL